ncbi:MAG: hypothetical protein Q7T78_18755 [Rhodoferax sp.]|nr:hypothetical protein [Rhodoferax sp.]
MAHVKNVLQMLLLAGAGSASFYMAAHWLRAPREALDLSDLVVEPAPAKSGRPDVSSVNTNRLALQRDATLAPPDRSRAVPESTGDAFANLSWLPPPPPVVIAPPPRPPPPPPPTAPPLPFTFVGLMEKGTARPQAFLAKGDALLVVSAGDTIDNNTYRIETLSPQKIVITYLPMNTQQTLNILGAAQ